MMTMKEIAMEMGVTEEEWNAFAGEPMEEQIEITMTKNEIVKRLEELDREDFFLLMKDVWDNNDYKKANEIHTEQRKLTKMLEG